MDQLRDAGTDYLVARISSGDQAAWAALTDRFTNLLWSIARSMHMSSEDAADAVQTTWLRLVERLDDIREPDKVGSWLATAVRRECLAIIRRRRTVGLPESWDRAADPADPLDAGLLRDERDAELWRALHNLPARCGNLLRVLVTDPPPSYADVAEALGIPVGSIGPTRRRCLELLRGLLGSSWGGGSGGGHAGAMSGEA
jgi:RNA polymerase sigma factor (sigma-70 family)